MVLEQIQGLIESLLSLGPLGIFLGMFLESSIVPIPSEVVLVGAGAIGFSLFDIAIFGGIGSTLGAMVGYAIGRYAGRPFVRRFGKYFFITEGKLKWVDSWFKRWGIYSVLISRLIPLIPFKVFSIAAGIGRMNFWHFSLFTLIGAIPRALILGYFGSLLKSTNSIILMVVVLVAIVVIPILISRKSSASRHGKT